MRPNLQEFPPAVLSWWKVGEDPSKTEIMLFLREGFGHHTETLDLADMEEWLTEHHPEVFTTDGGERILDLGKLEPDVLAPCLKHARAKKWERSPLKGIELGHLVDAGHPYMSYSNARAWPTGTAVGVVRDGKVAVDVIPLEFVHGQRSTDQ